jgi:hypothetical protein
MTMARNTTFVLGCALAVASWAVPAFAGQSTSTQGPSGIGSTVGLQVTTASAQSPPSGDVSFEVGGFGGASGGLPTQEFSDAFSQGLRLGGARNISSDSGSSLKWLLGGHVAAGIGSSVFVTFDALVNRIANPSFRGTVLGQTFDITMKTVLTEYTGGLHYVLWLGRVSPYVAAGMGVVRLSASAEAGELPVDVSASESDFTTNFGGGLRLLGGSSWGIRPDFRIVRVPDETFFRTTVGVFYQIR